MRPVGGVFEHHFIFAPGDGNLTNQKLNMSNAREREGVGGGGLQVGIQLLTLTGRKAL